MFVSVDSLLKSHHGWLPPAHNLLTIQTENNETVMAMAEGQYRPLSLSTPARLIVRESDIEFHTFAEYFLPSQTKGKE